MAIEGASDKIHVVMMRWPGIAAGSHHSGGIEYRLGDSEIGHTHGNSSVDIPFPKKLRQELVAAGLVQPGNSHCLSGWVSVALSEDQDLRWAVILLGHSFELAKQKEARKKAC